MLWFQLGQDGLLGDSGAISSRIGTGEVHSAFGVSHHRFAVAHRSRETGRGGDDVPAPREFRADRIGHPESIAFASLFGAFIHQLRGERAEALEYANTVLALARERDIATQLAWGMSLHGWAVGMGGQTDDGIAEIRESLAVQQAAGSEVARPQFLAMLAEVCAFAQRYDEALAAADEGLRVSSTTSDHYWDSELRRFKGEALLRLGSASGAEPCFLGALADARNGEAKSLELRVAISLGRLRTKEGKRGEARELVAPICEWFAEGSDTADLVAAKTLLDALE